MTNITRPKKTINFPYWRKRLKDNFFIQFPSKVEERARSKALKAVVVGLTEYRRAFPYTDNAILIKETLDRILSSDEYLIFAKTPSPSARRGKRAPWQLHLELVIFALEICKGDKEMLLKIRETLQTSDSSTVPPAEESLKMWADKLPKHQKENFPNFRSVSNKNTQRTEFATEWANEMKRAYVSLLFDCYQRRSLRKPDYHSPVPKNKVIATVVEKYQTYLL